MKNEKTAVFEETDQPHAVYAFTVCNNREEKIANVEQKKWMSKNKRNKYTESHRILKSIFIHSLLALFFSTESHLFRNQIGSQVIFSSDLTIECGFAIKYHVVVFFLCVHTIAVTIIIIDKRNKERENENKIKNSLKRKIRITQIHNKYWMHFAEEKKAFQWTN